MRVLIITYYWPPAGGPGVQRWLKFVKYLPNYGVQPIVYVPENPTYPILDAHLNSEVAENIEIIKSPIREPYRFAELFSKKKSKTISKGIIPKDKISFSQKLLLFIRGNFFIPDARVFWVKPSMKYLLKYLKNNPVDVVITTGPPHSIHLIGLELKHTLNCKWMADFRDPWTTIHYHKDLKLTKKAKNKHLQLESEVLKNADKIIVTSPSTKNEFVQKTSKPVALITNGFDDEFEIDKSPNPDNTFSIAHIGTLLSDRNPEILWEVLSELIHENEAFKLKLELKFAGVVSDSVKMSLKHYNLNSFSRFMGYIPHDEAIALQRKAAVLLLLEIDRPETRAILPGKLFEYLAAQRPIIAIGPEKSDIELILNETQAGIFFDSSKKKELKREIMRLFELHKENKLTVNSINVEQYHRKNLAEKMAEALKEM